MPAAQSMLPSIVEPEHLDQANGVVIGTLYLAQVAGPILAGWLTWLGGQSGNDASLQGISLAFFVDSLAMLVALLLFQMIRSVPRKSVKQSVVKLIVGGVKFCWRDEGIRLYRINFFLYMVP